MLQVGIHAGIVLVGSSINEKGTLTIEMKKAQKKKSLLERMNSTSDNSANEKEQGQTFLLFPFDTNKYGGGKEDAEGMITKILRFKDKLTHILKGYLTEDQMKWDIFKGLGITDANQESKLTDDTVVKGIYDNISEQFVVMVSKLKNLDKTFRLKLTRTSKTKHFGAFPTFGDFWESMEIADEASKLKFTDSEVKNGKNDPTPAQAESSISEEEKDKQLAELGNVFTFAETPAADIVE